MIRWTTTVATFGCPVVGLIPNGFVYSLNCAYEKVGHGRSRIEVSNRTVGIVDDLDICTIGSLDEEDSLSMDVIWVETVDGRTVVGGKEETNHFGNKCLVFWQITVAYRWGSNGQCIFRINFDHDHHWRSKRSASSLFRFLGTSCTGDSLGKFI